MCALEILLDYKTKTVGSDSRHEWRWCIFCVVVDCNVIGDLKKNVICIEKKHKILIKFLDWNGHFKHDFLYEFWREHICKCTVCNIYYEQNKTYVV